MRKNTMLISSLIFVLALVPGCASNSNPGGLTEREVGGLTGAGIGAGSGAIIGSATGSAAAGTAIGLPIGLVAGGLIGEGMRQNKEAAKQAAREEVMKQEYGQSQPEVTSGVRTVESNKMYNPKTGQTFPDGYLFDPKSGEKLEPMKVF
ncbi:MAG: hypothetical protein HYZ83_08370 [Candidatus Omnitrophica bacterium]|nr:hypothetical protein [Candidatus Omnitrophota bacterium]